VGTSLAVSEIEKKNVYMVNECGSVGQSMNGVNVECMVRINDWGEE